ncbi:YlmC/YmxH family sporulation protein [Selenomonadales bacterium OttesenSCG-928-I06]|nr:YlmC/YmxH family sporulation protein [Selenomonadales bacterium OttesenSCG-928-I06]
MVKTSDLKVKEVVCFTEGRRLGNITDLEIDVETGKITAIVVPGFSRFLGILGRSEDVVIPWENITKIGTDVLLVDLSKLKNYKGLAEI